MIVHRFVYGNRDLTRIIAEELGYVSGEKVVADDSTSISVRGQTNIPGDVHCYQK